MKSKALWIVLVMFISLSCSSCAVIFGWSPSASINMGLSKEESRKIMQDIEKIMKDVARIDTALQKSGASD